MTKIKTGKEWAKELNRINDSMAQPTTEIMTQINEEDRNLADLWILVNRVPPELRDLVRRAYNAGEMFPKFELESLKEEVERLKEENDNLKETIGSMEGLIGTLEDQLDTLKKRFDEIRTYMKTAPNMPEWVKELTTYITDKQ